MTKVKVYNFEGKEVGDVTLNPEVFGLEVNENLVMQALRVQDENSRENYAHTKTRGEVRGGGRKPWRQKGTGRARVGSIRSPLWIGGGVTFGPRTDRNFSLQINKKMKKKALLMTLSDKAKENNVIVVDKFALSEAKTKQLDEALKKLKLNNESVLLATAAGTPELVRASGNLKKVEVIRADSLNVRDVLKHRYLVVEQEGLPVIEETYKL